jgi:accessory gene regulator B
LGYVEKTAESIAGSIKKNYPESSSVEVLRYALIAFINLIIVLIFVLTIALITGHLLNALTAVIAFPLVRYFSGGLHLRSSMVCNIISSILILFSVYTPLSYWYTGFTLNLLTILFLALYAPSGIKKSKLPKSSYPILKVIAILIVSTNLIFHSPVLSIAFFLQSITTIPAFSNILDRTNW